MSYSHYWYRPMTIADDVFHAIKEDVSILEKEWKKQGIRVSYQLQFMNRETNEMMEVEGIQIETNNESFIFPKVIPEFFKEIFLTMKDGRIFQFTNIRSHRYDVAVQAFLIMAKRHLKDSLLVTSDGGDYRWQDGRDFVQKHLEFGEEFLLDESPSFDEMNAKISWVYTDENGEKIEGSNFEEESLPEIDKDIEEIAPDSVRELAKAKYGKGTEE